MVPLWEACQPLVNRLRLRFRGRPLYEEYDILAYAGLRELARTFKPHGKRSFYGYAPELLPLRIASDVGEEEDTARQQVFLADQGLGRDDDGDAGGEAEDAVLYEAAQDHGDTETRDGDAANRAILRLMLTDALSKLTPYQRAVVVAHVVEEFEFPEIAAALGKSADACCQAYHAAIRKLRKELKEKVE